MAGTKRQETTSSLSLSSLRSSSSRRESTPPPGNRHAKAATANVGCMSGIFQLISKYHTRRKFLTFRKRQDAHMPSSQPQQPKPEPITCPSRDQDNISMRISLDSPRTPTIIPPPEVRTSTSTSSPPVVARLMGLLEIPPSPAVESAAEKRRKLLGALEKCDEDLRALKKIIDSVRVPQTPPRAVVERMKEREDEDENEDEDEMVTSEGPSPVSVLDHHNEHDNMLITRSPTLVGYSNRIKNGQALQQQEINKHPRQQTMIRKKPGQEDHNATIYLPNRKPLWSVTETTPQSMVYPPTRRRPLTLYCTATTLITSCSAAMKESVSEVCKDLAQGQRREFGRMALLLQDFIYGDLVDEIIKDFGGGYYDHGVSTPVLISLPFEACKRQLCFS